MNPARWCIVVADAAGPEWPLSEDIDAPRAPVQFCGLGEPTTMLQKALHRAVRIAKAARVMVTIHKYGNTTAGTIPLSLWDYESMLRAGDRLILAAFGGGFTWAGAYLTWAYDSH